jgi:hypothetical protein
MGTLKITHISNALGLSMLTEILARLKLQNGEAVFVAAMPDGAALTPYDPEVAEQLSTGSEFMDECRDTYRGLVN